MIVYKCHKCDIFFLNGVDLFNHIENTHELIPPSKEKKCPECASEKVAFLAKSFHKGKEKCHIYYCSSCSQPLKIQFN